MSLLRAAALPSDPPSSWLPSHVQVTVFRARGLRCKGKAGTSDAYAVIQLGRERYRTAVAEKSTGSAEWGEQCAFELPPEPPAGAQPGLLLLLTVLHRALVGTDRFLGQAALPLEPALRQGRGPDERWYKLHSKAGKKEKERGEILVSIQFTRNNLTASMFDLSMKDKPRSPFGKLKDKMKGKKKYDLESASAIIPSSMGALDMEDDYDLGKKSKVKGFFLKNKLRKSSLTQSNTSLGSDSTISSASLSLAANVPEVTKSPSRHSSLSMERSVKDLLPSPKLTHKRAFSDDVSQVSPVLEPKAIQHLKPKNDPVSRSSLCINGSHVYGDEPVPKSSVTVPQSSAPVSVPSVPRRQEENFGFTPLHPDIHEVPWGLGSLERTQQRDEPRFIPSPPSLALQEELKVSTKAVTLSNHLGRAKMEENSRLENKPTQAAAPMVFSTDMTKDKQPDETRKEDKKAKSGLFHHGGKGQGEKGGPLSVHAAAAGGEERSKTSSWFSSKEPKESPQRPSLEVSPQVETSSDAPSHSPPCSPAQFAPAVALLTSMPRANLPPALRDGQSGCLSPTNPFLNSLQSNPFFEDLLADQVLNSPSPTHFFSSFPSEPHPSTEVAGNFDSSEDCSPSASLRDKDPERESPAKSVGVPVPETTPPSSQAELPPPDEKPAVPPPLSEWDDTFDAFATSRLKPEPKEDSFFVSVASEGMAFIDDPDAASPTERSSESAHEKGTKVFKEVNSQMGSEMPSTLRSWTNFSGLDVGANLVSTTQEATVIEDVLSPVSAGLAGRRRKSSTPTVWTTAFAPGNPGEKETSTPLTTNNSAREEGDSNEEEPSSPGTNGWMTIATETTPDPSESTQSGTEPEHGGLESAFGDFEAKSRSHSTTGVLTRSTFTPELSSETLPGSNVVAVSPRLLTDTASQRFSSAPEQGTEPQGSEEEAFDIWTSVYRLQASMRLEASEGRARLGSDVRERHVVLAPWPGTQEREDMAASSAVPPPKPPRWFAAAGSGGAGHEGDVCDPQPRHQRGSEERGEDAESPEVDVELPRSHQSSEPSVPASPSLTLIMNVGEARREFPASSDAESVDSAANLDRRAGQLAEGDTSVREGQAEMDETDTAEQFVTCSSRLFPDGLDQSGAQESRSQPVLSPRKGAAGCDQEDVASEQMSCPEELSVVGLNPPSKLDLVQPETFWTALEEQEAADHPTGLSPAMQPQRLERGESPSQADPAWGDAEGQHRPVGGQPEPGIPVAVAIPPQEAEQGRPGSEHRGSWRRCSAGSRIDFKKADFWKPERAEESRERDASAPRNPFAPALSPNAPSNPFVDKSPDPLPVQAALPEQLGQGSFSFSSPHKEALGQGFQPTNLPGDLLGKPPSLHANQPLAFSTPFLVAATNPNQFDFPSPMACPASSGIPAASSRAVAQPCPLPQSGDTQASALVVLPRETQPAEKSFFQQMTSPHPVKPISAATQEVSSEKKQQHRSSLSSALSNGLEKLKMATTSSVQPVAPSSHLEKTDSKVLKDPNVLDQSAKYYHLTHDELIQLLLQREKELSKKEEHIHELENYIDQLLVRIMEQSPTLLQIPLEESKAK